MARIVENYQALQDTVRLYLNRTDLDEQIPTFIYFAERKIFRWYRNQNNEKLITLDMRVTPEPLITTQVSLSPQLDLPDDYIETLTLQAFPWSSETGSLPAVGGQTLRRVSQNELLSRRYQNNRDGSPVTGTPEVFARIRDALYLSPAPDSDCLITWQYYCDLSGLFDTPTSDNAVLKVAPDMYVYATLLEAEPYLKPEDAAFARLPIWKSYYEEAKQAIIEQNDAEVYSGSVNEINNSFSAGPGAVRGGFA